MTISETSIEAPATIPSIILTREFLTTPAQLHRAHTDPDIYARWVGPSDIATEIVHWDARTGGSWAYRNVRDGVNGREEYTFHGSFHDVRDDRIVQTFSFDGMPDAVSLEILSFEDLGGGHTLLRGTSLFDSYESRDGMLASGMEVGINEGYAALDRLIQSGAF